jgi:hypothetical protein
MITNPREDGATATLTVAAVRIAGINRWAAAQPVREDLERAFNRFFLGCIVQQWCNLKWR